MGQCALGTEPDVNAFENGAQKNRNVAWFRIEKSEFNYAEFEQRLEVGISFKIY